MNLGPVSVAINADEYSFKFYASGIYDPENCSTDLDHAMAIVGYNNSGGSKFFNQLPYWIVRNSWGTDWGN